MLPQLASAVRCLYDQEACIVQYSKHNITQALDTFLNSIGFEVQDAASSASRASSQCTPAPTVTRTIIRTHTAEISRSHGAYHHISPAWWFITLLFAILGVLLAVIFTSVSIHLIWEDGLPKGRLYKRRAAGIRNDLKKVIETGEKAQIEDGKTRHVTGLDELKACMAALDEIKELKLDVVGRILEEDSTSEWTEEEKQVALQAIRDYKAMIATLPEEGATATAEEGNLVKGQAQNTEKVAEAPAGEDAKSQDHLLDIDGEPWESQSNIGGSGSPE